MAGCIQGALAAGAAQVKEILAGYKIGRLKGGADPGLKDLDPYKNEPKDRWAARRGPVLWGAMSCYALPCCDASCSAGMCMLSVAGGGRECCSCCYLPGLPHLTSSCMESFQHRPFLPFPGPEEHSFSGGTA